MKSSIKAFKKTPNFFLSFTTNISNKDLKTISTAHQQKLFDKTTTMQLIKIITLLAPLLATSAEASRFVFHSLNHCKHSPVDRSCSKIKAGTCCKNPSGGLASSITFHNVKGRVVHATKNGCDKTVYKHKAASKNLCVFNGKFNGGFDVNPVAKRQDDGDDGATTCCSATVEPDQVIVYGDTAFDIVSMSTEQMDDLNALASNGTAIADWPADLTAFITADDEE